jgi:hypothetical protein
VSVTSVGTRKDALIPHDAIDASTTFSSLVGRYRFQAPNSK